MALSKGKFGGGNSKGGKGRLQGKSFRFIKRQTARWARRVSKDQAPQGWGKGYAD